MANGTNKVYLNTVTDFHIGFVTDPEDVVFDIADTTSFVTCDYFITSSRTVQDFQENRIKLLKGLSVTGSFGQYAAGAIGRFGNILNVKPTLIQNGSNAILTYENVANIGWCQPCLLLPKGRWLHISELRTHCFKL